MNVRHVGPTTPRPNDTSAPGHLGQDGSAQNLRHLGSRKRHLGSSKIKTKIFDLNVFILSTYIFYQNITYQILVKEIELIKKMRPLSSNC